MITLFKLEWKRLKRNFVIPLCLLLLALIGLLGAVLSHIYYSKQNDPRYLLYGLYNSYAQFTYLILGFVVISVYAKDYQNGVYAWYRQMNRSFKQVATAKTMVLLTVMLPFLNVVFIIAQIVSKNQDIGYFAMCLVSANLSMIYIVALAFIISVLVKKVIQATLIMYGLYVLFNGLNLIGYGVINPSDSNSIVTYCLGKIINPSQTHYSLDKLSVSASCMRGIAFGVPILWMIILLVIWKVVEQKERGRNA